jgi:hypothetical protein
MMLNTTAKEFRPDAATSSHSTEDLQPNEGINKRQRAAPPTVLPASVKPPLPRNNYTRWRHGSGGGSDGSGIGQSGRGSWRGGWTQYALRGNKSWRGARSSGRGHGTSDSPAWSQSFRPESEQTRNTMVPVTMKPLESQTNETSLPCPDPLPHPMFPVAPPSVTNPLLIEHDSRPNPTQNSPASPNAYQGPVQPPESPELLKVKSEDPDPMSSQMIPDELMVPSLILKRSVSPLVRCSTPPSKRRKLDHTSTIVKAEEVERAASSRNFQIHSYPTPNIAKAEPRSPSPPPRRLVTESCSFYPLPEDCRKSHPEHKKNRHAFFAREYNILKCLGLKRTKVFFRFVYEPFPRTRTLIIQPGMTAWLSNGQAINQCGPIRCVQNHRIFRR